MVAAQPLEPIPEQIQIATSLKCQTDDNLTDCYTDRYMDKIHGILREPPEDKDDLLHKYYLNDGWAKEQEQ